MTPVVALTIAGSDSCSGAGIQADLKTFAAFGVYGTCAVTAVTAQTSRGVERLAVMDRGMVAAQIHAVLNDMGVKAVKTGMLADESIVEEVGAAAARGLLHNLVVDPVLAASTGRPLLGSDGPRALREMLLPYAEVTTPNLHEAAALVGCSLSELRSVNGMVDAAERIRALGTTTVIVTGGHVGRSSPDVVVGPTGVVVLEGDAVATPNDHGTGCTFSAGVAAGLALGWDTVEAARSAKRFVTRALRGSARWQVGSGPGPLDHFGWGEQP